MHYSPLIIFIYSLWEIPTDREYHGLPAEMQALYLLYLLGVIRPETSPFADSEVDVFKRNFCVNFDQIEDSGNLGTDYFPPSNASFIT